MHICYVDDSSRGDFVSLTGLLVPAASWTRLLELWTQGRQQLTDIFGVTSDAELHASELVRGKGELCSNTKQEKTFKSRDVRLRAYEIMLKKLGECEDLIVTTTLGRTRRADKVYKAFVAHLQEFAEVRGTQVVIFLDGKEGTIDSSEMTDEEVEADRETAFKNAAHFRDVHLVLDPSTRRVIDDPVIRSSKYSHLMQAADLAAYATYHYLWETTEHWSKKPKDGKPNSRLVKECKKSLSRRWLPDDAETTDGVRWVDVPPDPRDEETPG